MPNTGQYFAAIFELDGYTEIAPRQYFYVGATPVLSSDFSEYPLGASVNISFTNAPHLADDWIGIYKMGHTPGGVGSTAYQYTSATTETLTFNNLPKGYYYAEYFLEDGYSSIGNTVYFKVGDLVSELWINKPVYDLGENIIASWTDGPGIIKDWLGIYNEGDDPNIDPLISYTYFEGLAEGSKTIATEELPTQMGNYYIVMFVDDSYNEVSNRVEFEVIDESLDNDDYEIDNGLSIYPNPSSNNKQTFISSQYPIDKIEIYNTNGQILYETKNVNNNKYSLITQDMPSGIYILKIHSRKVYTAKLIID